MLTIICNTKNIIRAIDEKDLFKSFSYKRHKSICPICKKEETSILDERIAPLIITLNKYGYLTNYSCSSHIDYDKNRYDTYPYICFKFIDITDMINYDKYESKDAITSNLNKIVDKITCLDKISYFDLDIQPVDLNDGICKLGTFASIINMSNSLYTNLSFTFTEIMTQYGSMKLYYPWEICIELHVRAFKDFLLYAPTIYFKIQDLDVMNAPLIDLSRGMFESDLLFHMLLEDIQKFFKPRNFSYEMYCKPNMYYIGDGISFTL